MAIRFTPPRRRTAARKKYRATMIGPGVTPDVTWEGPAPAAYDAAVDAEANAAQQALLGQRPHLQDQLAALR